MMNEIIDELMVQAGARFEFLHGVHYDDFQYRKFAELLVKECVKVCNEQEYSYWKATEDQDFTPVDCAIAIKEHFGVE